MPIMQFVGNLGYVMVALLGGVFVIKKSIEVGDIQSFFQYIRNFTQPIQQIAQVTNLLQSSAAASERVFEFLEEPEESQNETSPADIEKLTGDVQFEHVKFGYNPDKIIVKRPLKSEFLAGRKPSYTLSGKAIRYDCYTL